MNDFAWFDALDRIDQFSKQGSITVHRVAMNVDDCNSELKFGKVLLKFKALVDGDKHINDEPRFCDERAVE